MRLFGISEARKVRRQFFGGDDVARQRDQAALQFRRRIAGIAVGGDHDVADLDVTARGRDPPALAGRRDGLHRRLGAERDLAAARRVEQSLVVERRMQLGRALHHHAAVVIVGRHLLPLPFLRHHEGARSGIGIEGCDATLLIGVVVGRPRADKAAGLLPVAIDLFPLDQALDQAEGIVAGSQDVLQHVRLERRHLAGETLADVDAAADTAAASRAGAGAKFGRLRTRKPRCRHPQARWRRKDPA